MEPTISTHGADFATILALGAAGVAAVLLLIVLQKHLRIFTRGTVTFMATVVMVATVISLVDLGNDVRNREHSARDRGRRAVGANFVRNWLDRDDALLVRKSTDRSSRRIRTDLDRADKQLCESLSRSGVISGAAGSCDTPLDAACLDKFRLVSLNVLESHRFHPSDFGRPQWKFEALLAADDVMMRIKGHVATNDEDRRVTRLAIQNIEAFHHDPSLSPHWCMCRLERDSRGTVYRSPHFEHGPGHVQALD